VLIDWFTVIAQTVNFLVLVWLLKRFFYRPVLNALDARERRIAAELAEAGAKKLEADKERDEFQRKTHELEQQRSALLSKALEEAQVERQRLLAAAHEDAAKWRAKWEETWNSDYQGLSDVLAQKTCAEILATTRKVLSDIASSTLEALIVDVFIQRVRELSADQRAQLVLALAAEPAATAAASPEWVIRSTFVLSSEQKENIEQVLQENLLGDKPVRFMTDPSLIAGIELIARGHKLAWTIADYLSSLEREVERLWKNRAAAEHELQPESETQLDCPLTDECRQ
jgi:F-type H+-transporting ATPase subunit b